MAEFQSKNLNNYSYKTPLPLAMKHQQPTSTRTTIFYILTIFCCSLIMVMALFFWFTSQTPVLQINSLSVSNFTVSNTKLAADWIADFTVYNPNLCLEISLERIESIIYYKEYNDALSISSTDADADAGLDLDIREQKKVTIKFATTGLEGDQPIIEYPVLREIEEDKKSGGVRFSMTLNMWVRYKTGYNWVSWRRNVFMNFYCLNLNVGVAAGSLIGSDMIRNCNVFVH